MRGFAAPALFIALLGFVGCLGGAIWLQTLGEGYKQWVDVLSLTGFAIFSAAGSFWVLFRGK
jgi:hypothetical protein